ncbi:MAG: YbhB/YbcL family Raf kinase inhibitor-like protein [Rhodoglobus sp.]
MAALSWIGRLLANRRAGASLSIWFVPGLRSERDLILTSPSFGDGEEMPQQFAGPGVGQNVSPALEWSGVPLEATHLLFVLEDTDTPTSRPLIHTVSILTPDVTSLAEGALARGAADVTHLKGNFATGYSGPRPIPGHGTHHYGFMLFAVDADIDTTNWRTAIQSVDGHVLARGRVVGTYERA